MSKFYYLILFAFLFSSSSFAQEDISNEESLLEKSMSSIKLSAFLPALEYNYEYRIKPKSSFEFRIGGLTGFDGVSYFDDLDLVHFKRFYVSPTLSIGYKYYVTLLSRKEKGRDISFNAGDYFGVSLVNGVNGLIFEKETRTPDFVLIGSTDGENFKRKYSDWSHTLSIVPKYGLNRNWTQKIGFNFEIGPQLYLINNKYRDVRFTLFVQTGLYLKL
ncbi:hypothetical protein [Sphingobacterium bovistauri]|uniref:Outer membrane protein beta-barrel domain-containing protein n=1 Tax=Sphingobacterium bovistauri TaxID=2781959 RepID=A0ABS7ZD05_9SPHI|nr:hypothetical protein [Sphingobacterium bovistauri]MCA5006614.1 hypothetical protein [Sphingobacterium bovistauri]